MLLTRLVEAKPLAVQAWGLTIPFSVSANSTRVFSSLGRQLTEHVISQPVTCIEHLLSPLLNRRGHLYTGDTLNLWVGSWLSGDDHWLRCREIRWACAARLVGVQDSSCRRSSCFRRAVDGFLAAVNIRELAVPKNRQYWVHRATGCGALLVAVTKLYEMAIRHGARNIGAGGLAEKPPTTTPPGLNC